MRNVKIHALKTNDSAIYINILKSKYIWLAGVNSHVGCMSHKLCQHRDSKTI